MAMLGEMLLKQYKGTIPGVATGLVKENWDEKHQGMVKVEMFLGEEGKSVTGWVPVMTHYAGESYGAYCLPEIGQVVVITFELGEKNCPIVIGALWDKKNVLPEETANDKNTIKRFKTKGGSEIVIDDESGKESITVTTPGKLTLQMQDEKKLLCLQDENAENAITMDCENGELTLCAKSKIKLMIGTSEAVIIDDSSVQVKSKDIKNEAQNGFSAEAQNINLTAKANVNVEGKAGANINSGGNGKVNANGMLEIKGSMVKIN